MLLKKESYPRVAFMFLGYLLKNARTFCFLLLKLLTRLMKSSKCLLLLLRLKLLFFNDKSTLQHL
ncbi:hypothetical protein BAZ12_10280 [Elizabethkingia miricola]|uniref:Uncharacterized protein n=1 Tax=Elizabethkingia miricola TaxID=172045 RepID=A0ABD4DNI6_ELIMR|nr:hypothetical protein ATB95_05410 [Elizabethkingia miricola]OPC70177.1 hypothetical protein BAZ12_10280 [Elizabethkingia miricola]